MGSTLIALRAGAAQAIAATTLNKTVTANSTSGSGELPSAFLARSLREKWAS